jgi:MutS domain V
LESTDSLEERTNSHHPRDAYLAAAERHASGLVGLRRRFRWVETGRVVTFLVGAIAGLLYRDLPISPVVTLVIAGASGVVFIALVVRHRRLRRKIRRAEAAETLARLGSLRLGRRWSEMADALASVGYDDPLLLPSTSDESHPYLWDLDLFGVASVRALLGPTPTPTGVETLRRWLSAPAPIAEVRRRQSAVRSLVSDFEGRERLAVEGLLVERVDREAWTGFLGWLEGPALFGPLRYDSKPSGQGDAGSAHAPGASPARLPAWSIHVARFMPPITLGLFAYYLAVGGISAWTWVIPLIAQAALAWRWGLALGSYFDRASRSSPGLRRHHTLFSAWEEYVSDEAAVRALQGKLGGDTGVRASREIRSLERWLDSADSRASSLHIVLSAGVFWDVHVAWGLERWRGRAGAHVETWFDVLGELEGLAALSTLAHDHPDWCWPELSEGVPGLEADGLGHPLLPESVLVTSDVRLDPPGRFLLVTGSNMSGKSTLLRSIGLAAVLAQAGSVVCARRARLTPLRTFTSMRIHDSLTGGVSLFMAELLRLKALVDAADGSDGRPALLYLIDEVLQGTNSEERRVAARRIVGHLLGANAIGAVTTHDLALHEDPRLDPASSKVHYREQVGEEGDHVLTFDYRLRPGLATSRNALKLLRIVGLDDDTTEEEAGGVGEGTTPRRLPEGR